MTNNTKPSTAATNKATTDKPKTSRLQRIALSVPLIGIALLLNGYLLVLWIMSGAFTTTSYHYIGGYVLGVSCAISLYIIAFMKQNIAIKYVTQIIGGALILLFL